MRLVEQHVPVFKQLREIVFQDYKIYINAVKNIWQELHSSAEHTKKSKHTS
jgi:hypothetical protein